MKKIAHMRRGQVCITGNSNDTTCNTSRLAIIADAAALPTTNATTVAIAVAIAIAIH